MPIYKYRFCDGTVSNVEVSDKEFALLTDMDRRENANNRRHRRHGAPLARYVRYGKKPDRGRDKVFKGDNE